MFDMGMRPNGTNPGHTYRFYTGTPCGVSPSLCREWLQLVLCRWYNCACVSCRCAGTAVYPFGHGLSYTTFAVNITSDLPRLPSSAIAAQLASGASRGAASPLTTVNVTVTNTGNVASDYVVLLFVTPPNPGKNGSPLKYAHAVRGHAGVVTSIVEGRCGCAFFRYMRITPWCLPLWTVSGCQVPGRV